MFIPVKSSAFVFPIYGEYVSYIYLIRKVRQGIDECYWFAGKQSFDRHMQLF
jgi:hypothetical protein